MHTKIFIPLLLIAWALMLNFSGLDSFHVQYAASLAIAFVGLSFFVMRQFNFIVGLTFCYFTIASIFKMVFPQASFQGFDISEIVGIECLVTSSVLYLIIFTFVLSTITPNLLRTLKLTLLGFSLLDSIVMVYRFLNALSSSKAYLDQSAYFLFNNPAIDAAFIACTLPLFLEELENKNLKVKILTLIFPLYACFMSMSSSGVMGLAIAFGAYSLAQGKFKKQSLAVAFFIGTGVSLVGYLLQKNLLFQGSGRIHVWKITMEYWDKHIGVLGAGLGTFQMYGSAVQLSDMIQNKVVSEHAPLFFWMHNDWLQVLFESGVIGLALVILCFILALLSSSKKPALFSSLLTFGAVALIQMPLRHVIFTCLLAYLLTRAFRFKFEKSELL